MRKLVVALLTLGLFIGPAAGARTSKGREGCQAFDPLQPTCRFTVTHHAESPVTGIGGSGDWIVFVKRGDETLRYESPANGQVWLMEVAFRVGDKVTAKALSPGSGLTVGHED